MYRVRQFLQALAARVRPEEWAVVEEILTPAQRALFAAMPDRDQRHGIEVLHALRQRGTGHPALWQAALLHDVGKAGALCLWHRVAVVLLERFTPGLLSCLAADRPGSWRYPFYVHLHHPWLGAARVQAAGGEPLVVRLIASHHQPATERTGNEERELLVALQSVDGHP